MQTRLEPIENMKRVEISKPKGTTKDGAQPSHEWQSFAESRFVNYGDMHKLKIKMFNKILPKSDTLTRVGVTKTSALVDMSLTPYRRLTEGTRIKL